MYQNAGEKGTLHPDPDDPPRRRANKKRGHGTYENDRPPVAGIVGRDSGQIRLRVVHNSTRANLEPFVLGMTTPGTNAFTDEWGAYNHLAANDRPHATVSHGAREWARDDDGDGINEVHCNTMEGIWTGLRNYLRIVCHVRCRTRSRAMSDSITKHAGQRYEGCRTVVRAMSDSFGLLLVIVSGMARDRWRWVI